MIERAILSNLIHNEEYSRKALAFLKPEYFHEQGEKIVYELIDNYIKKYNNTPTSETLLIDLQGQTSINELQYKNCNSLIEV